MKVISSILFILFAFPAFAGVLVKGHVIGDSGKAFGYKNFSIELVDDFITHKKTPLATGKSGKHGDFEISFELPKTGLIYISFNRVQRTFYAEPGKSYYIDIKVPLEGLSNKNRVLSNNIRKANIVNRHPQEINYLIDTLEYACSNFLKTKIAERRDKKQMDAFIVSLKKEFGHVRSSYFKDYLRYKGAELELYFYRNKREEFALKYFDHESEIAGHVQKMQVFSSFFKGNMRYNILIDDHSPFHLAFNKSQLSICLKHIYSANTSNRELRELLLLKGIQEVHAQNYYPLRKQVAMLDKIISEGHHTAHHSIAKHLKNSITHLKESYPAPALVVKDATRSFHLSAVKDKYVYLCFFQSWDEGFDREMEIMEMLKEKYSSALEIVCIGVGEDVKAFEKLREKHNNGIKMVHYNYQAEVLQNYDIQAFRLDRYDIESVSKYFLVDPEGYLVFSPALSPSSGFHRDFQRIIAQ